MTYPIRTDISLIFRVYSAGGFPVNVGRFRSSVDASPPLLSSTEAGLVGFPPPSGHEAHNFCHEEDVRLPQLRRHFVIPGRFVVTPMANLGPLVGEELQTTRPPEQTEANFVAAAQLTTARSITAALRKAHNHFEVVSFQIAWLLLFSLFLDRPK